MGEGSVTTVDRFRDGMQTATGQASLLFVVAGLLGLITEIFVQAQGPRLLSIAINLVAIAAGGLMHVAPWHRLPSWAPLAVAVPVAFGLLAVGQRLAPGVAPAYGVWFVVVYAWIGFWYPPRMAAVFAPLGAIAYVAPFIGQDDVPPDVLGSVVIVISAAVILGEVLASKMDAIKRTQRELVEARGLLERASLTDDLTGLGNRRQANALIDSLQPRDALVLLDLDHFKLVNDTFGHPEGDRVLMAIGVFLQAAVRDADSVTRFGGEEFLVVLRGAGDHAVAAAQRLVEAWRTYRSGVTLSAGVALHHAGRSPIDTLRAADVALYDAKGRGRDQVAVEHGDARPTVRLGGRAALA
jgi:diguanylate cyclase (GGDEF)-like protein